MPSDLVSRGLTLERFKACSWFCCHDPGCLCYEITPWSTQILPYLNQRSQRIARSACCCHSRKEFSTVRPLEKFPSFLILLRVIALAIEFINWLRRLDVDRERLASILLMMTMKQKSYPEELAFLPDSSCRNFPWLLGTLSCPLAKRA